MPIKCRTPLFTMTNLESYEKTISLFFDLWSVPEHTFLVIILLQIKTTYTHLSTFQDLLAGCHVACKQSPACRLNAMLYSSCHFCINIPKFLTRIRPLCMHDQLLQYYDSIEAVWCMVYGPNKSRL